MKKLIVISSALSTLFFLFAPNQAEACSAYGCGLERKKTDRVCKRSHRSAPAALKACLTESEKEEQLCIERCKCLRACVLGSRKAKKTCISSRNQSLSNSSRQAVREKSACVKGRRKALTQCASKTAQVKKDDRKLKFISLKRCGEAHTSCKDSCRSFLCRKNCYDQSKNCKINARRKARVRYLKIRREHFQCVEKAGEHKKACMKKLIRGRATRSNTIQGRFTSCLGAIKNGTNACVAACNRQPTLPSTTE